MSALFTVRVCCCCNKEPRKTHRRATVCANFIILAGKGRTGTGIAAYLVRSGEIPDPEEAIKFFGVKRSASGNGINVPSQMRYIQPPCPFYSYMIII